MRSETYDSSTNTWKTATPKLNGIAGHQEAVQRAGKTSNGPSVTWPAPPAPEAFYDLAGDVVRTIEPHSEADPVGLLVHIITLFGNVIGPSPCFRVESEYHHTNLDVVAVGDTGKSRKGTSRGRSEEMFKKADADWLSKRVLGGLSSGEGVIWACRDPIFKHAAIHERGTRKITGYEEEMIDPGVTDKRTLFVETEFSRVLKMSTREGNILIEILRQSWDSGNLRSVTKTNPATATGAHISIMGHITRDELLRRISETEMANGLGNRFQWYCVRRSKCLPDDEDRHLDHIVVAEFQERIRSAVEFAKNVGEMHRDHEAKLAWRAVYPHLSDGRPGLVGAMTGRSEAQVLRLSMIYALMDRSAEIRLPHLKAALGLWEYSERCVKYIFGDSLGDPTADTILASLRNSPMGLTRSDISALFSRNKPSSEIARALGALASLGVARFEHRETDTRPSVVWFAA